jgi:hypothetical protein
LFSGQNSDKLTYGAPVQGAGSQTALAERLGSLTVLSSSTTLGANVFLKLNGEPGGALLPYLSSVQMHARQFDGIQGSLVLDLGAHSSLPAEFLDGLGRATISLQVPMAPALVGMSFLVQGLHRSPLGALDISPPLVIGIQ